MKSRVIVEIGLLGCAICLAWAAAYFALRSGILSAQNTWAAIVAGTVGYMICRAISFIPIATHWTRYTKFFATAGVCSFMLYLYIIWTNAQS